MLEIPSSVELLGGFKTLSLPYMATGSGSGPGLLEQGGSGREMAPDLGSCADEVEELVSVLYSACVFRRRVLLVDLPGSCAIL